MSKYFLGLIFVPLMALAQPPVEHGKMNIVCSTTEHVEQQIKKFNEMKLWSGVESPTVVVTLWQNLETKSFTLTKTEVVHGITCIISMGASPKES